MASTSFESVINPKSPAADDDNDVARSRLADNLIERANTKQLADVARLLARNCR